MKCETKKNENRKKSRHPRNKYVIKKSVYLTADDCNTLDTAQRSTAASVVFDCVLVLQQRLDFDSTAIRLLFDCYSTEMRPFDDLCCDPMAL